MQCCDAGLCVDGAAAWTQAKAAGQSPAELAIAMGFESTHMLVSEQLRATMALSMSGMSSLTPAFSQQGSATGSKNLNQEARRYWQYGTASARLLYLHSPMPAACTPFSKGQCSTIFALLSITSSDNDR